MTNKLTTNDVAVGNSSEAELRKRVAEWKESVRAENQRKVYKGATTFNDDMANYITRLESIIRAADEMARDVEGQSWGNLVTVCNYRKLREGGGT